MTRLTTTALTTMRHQYWATNLQTASTHLPCVLLKRLRSAGASISHGIQIDKGPTPAIQASVGSQARSCSNFTQNPHGRRSSLAGAGRRILPTTTGIYLRRCYLGRLLDAYRG
ncbi:TPA: hypothetical protein ACH3X1_006039 [Trebouxia sp. C0004]